MFIFTIVGANGRLTIGNRYMYVHFCFRFVGKQITCFRIRSNYKFILSCFAILNCFRIIPPPPPRKSKFAWETKWYGSRYEVQLLRSDHM